MNFSQLYRELCKWEDANLRLPNVIYIGQEHYKNICLSITDPMDRMNFQDGHFFNIPYFVVLKDPTHLRFV